MMKHLCSLLLLISLFPLPGRAQTTAEAKAAHPLDLDSVHHMMQRADQLSIVDAPAALVLEQQTLKLARQLGQPKPISECLRMLGTCCSNMGKSLEAQAYFEQAIAVARQAGWLKGVANGYLGLGGVAYGQDDFRGAQRFFLLAGQTFAQASSKTSVKASGMASDSALTMARLLVTLSLVAVDLELHDDAAAARACRQALALPRFRTQDNQRALALLNMAEIQLRSHFSDSARANATAGLRLATERQYVAGLHNILAQCELFDHRLAAARQQSLQAVQLSSEGGFVDIREEALQTLADVLHALHRPEAYDTLKRYIALHDTLLTQTRIQAVAQAQARFGSREQQAQIRALQQARRLAAQSQELARLRSRYQLAGLGGLAVLALLLGGGLFWRYRQQQVIARVAAENTLRQQIAADLHDDVGSLLTQVSLQSDLLSQGVLAPEQQPAHLQRMADTSREAVRHMSDVVWGLSQLGPAPTLGPLLDRMRDHAHAVLPTAGLELDFQADPALRGLGLAPAEQQALFLIYKEALHNATKHARQASVVRVVLRQEPGRLRLEVRDNGNGAGLAAAGRPGHGLRNMRARAQAVGGEVAYEPGPEGFGVVAWLPLA